MTVHRNDSAELGILSGAGFGIDDDPDIHHRRLTAADGDDRQFIRVDVSDSCGPPSGVGLFPAGGQ